MSEQTTEQKPWYREPWPWVAIAIPGIAVVMGMVTLYLALTYPDHIVVDETEYQSIRSEMKAQSSGGDTGDTPDGVN